MPPATDGSYSLARARTSLRDFALGKAATALTGIAVLLLTVRTMPASDYGSLIALLALLEIFYLASGFGLSGIAQRYVPEFATRARPVDLRRLVRNSLLARLAIALLASIAAAAAAGLLMRLLGMAVPSVPLATFSLVLGALLLSGTMVRYFDELLAALLMQATSQGLALFRNLGKLPWLGWALGSGHAVQVGEMLLLEIGLALVSMVAAALAMRRALRRRQPAPADAAAPPAPRYRAPGMWPVSLRFYIVQLLGQIYGPNALKLLVARTLGLEATAVFGFTLSLTDMVRNYMPAHLLAGWIRPLLVARFVESRSVGQLCRLTGLVLKINLIGVLAFAAYFSAGGDALGGWISSGRYPHTGALLVALTLLVGLQTAHLLLTMVTLTLERAKVNLLATALACVGLPLAVWWAPAVGLIGVAAALATAEAVWIGTVWLGVRRSGIALSIDWRGLLKLLLPGALGAAVAVLAQRHLGWPAPGAGAAGVLLFWTLAYAARPLLRDEIEVIRKFLPARWGPR